MVCSCDKLADGAEAQISYKPANNKHQFSYPQDARKSRSWGKLYVLTLCHRISTQRSFKGSGSYTLIEGTTLQWYRNRAAILVSASQPEINSLAKI